MSRPDSDISTTERAASAGPRERTWTPRQWALSTLATFVGGGWIWTPKRLPLLPHRARSLLLLFAFVVLAGLLRHLSALPELGERPQLPIRAQEAGPLAESLASRIAEHPGHSGIRLLVSAEDAFAARMELAEVATRTLDVQVYIWREDLTGTLLLEALHQAADRGVRVRLLLDDNGAQGLDEALAALDAHPRAEVRLFNPFRFRTHRWFNFVTDFQRLNRRMHNKAFIADDAVAIVGGRNVGDEYFGPTEGVLFIDLDALAVGEVVEDVSHNFERYWQSSGAWPLERLLEVPEADLSAWQERHDVWMARVEQAQREAPVDPGVEQVARTRPPLIDGLLDGTLSLTWAPVRMLSDHPDKALGQLADNERMLRELIAILAGARTRVELVSPYFVPGKVGTERLGELPASGVALRILTNALEATDVPAVQAGYAKRRRPLLEAGVRLFELEQSRPEEARGRSGTWWSGSSSGSSLHAKTFAVDGRSLFVGSFNFDPRSASLNTEMGLVIEAPELAVALGALFEGPILDRAYEVQLTEKGDLQWIDREGETVTLLDEEPNSSAWMRLWIAFLGVLPIEWLL
ncbi:MAG TPA: phospholipase D family protein [Myxococcaceae bacterium]|nr:phospholipase D family protein [Myxococcaceae bacterium]